METETPVQATLTSKHGRFIGLCPELMPDVVVMCMSEEETIDRMCEVFDIEVRINELDVEICDPEPEPEPEPHFQPLQLIVPDDWPSDTEPA